jgi:hypothetical protein
MSYAILRTKKISSSSLGGMTSHIGRTRETPNADPELTPNNKVISGVGAKEALQGIRERLKGVEALTGRKVRKDAVVAIEVMQTASPAFFEGKNSEEIQVWANQNIIWLKNHFGTDNVLSATLHLDETTPHIHAIVFPQNSKGRLCAKDWLGGADKLSAMQDSYAQEMDLFALERGKKGSKARHIEIREWYGKGLQALKDRFINLYQSASKLQETIVADIETGKAYQVLDPFTANSIKQIQDFKIEKKLHKKGFGYEIIQQVLIDFLNVCPNDFFIKKAKSIKDLNDFEVGLGESFKNEIIFPGMVKSTREPARELHKKEQSKGFEIGD